VVVACCFLFRPGSAGASFLSRNRKVGGGSTLPRSIRVPGGGIQRKRSTHLPGIERPIA